MTGREAVDVADQAGRSAAPLLSLRGVHRSFRGGWAGWGTDRAALCGVDLDLRPGEVVGLAGPSGAGKSTLARAAVGLCRPDRGEIRVCGRDPYRMPVHRDAQLLFQDAGASLNPGLTAEQILLESARAHPEDPGLPPGPAPGLPPGARSPIQRVSAALARVGLAHRRHALPGQLSGGERRRLTLAQLWMTAAPLLIADEPTAGLDAARRADLIALLLARVGSGGLLLISHDFPLLIACCARVAVLLEGRIVDRFTPAEVGHPDRHPWTRQTAAITGFLP